MATGENDSPVSEVIKPFIGKKLLSFTHDSNKGSITLWYEGGEGFILFTVAGNLVIAQMEERLN